MGFWTMIDDNPLILAEGSVIERIRREFRYPLDGDIANAGMIYEEEGRAVLSAIYRGYMETARRSDLPILNLTPTWRASHDRLERVGLTDVDVNRDCVEFLMRIRDEYGEYGKKILIGGLMGCRGDAYDPDDALDAPSARAYHAYQAERLAAAGVDLLLASTFPSAREAEGVAAAMAESGLPYIVSFVVLANGTLPDGTFLREAIAAIDATVTPAPSAYMLNCVHPDNVRKALAVQPDTAESNATAPEAAAVGRAAPIGNRLIGLQGNTSRMSPAELDGRSELDADPPERWARAMLRLHTGHGMKILGGCCGTDDRYIACIAERYLSQRSGNAAREKRPAVDEKSLGAGAVESAPEPAGPRDNDPGTGAPVPVELPIDGALDLHTFQAGEVKDLVPEYLEACRERGILEVRIIHGKGTGALRETVHAILRRLPYVESFHLAGEGGGGWGATIVTLSPR
jgi:homocysteine S-methyltransferase